MLRTGDVTPYVQFFIRNLHFPEYLLGEHFILATVFLIL